MPTDSDDNRLLPDGDAARRSAISATLSPQDAAVLDALVDAGLLGSGLGGGLGGSLGGEPGRGLGVESPGPAPGHVNEPLAIPAPLPPGAEGESAARAAKLDQLLGLLDAGLGGGTGAGDVSGDVSRTEVDLNPSGDLVARTVQAAQDAEQRRRFAAQVAMVSQPRPTLDISVRQVLTMAAVLLLSFSLLLPVLDHSRFHAERTACAANLGGAFGGMQRYAEDHEGDMPRRDAVAGAEWWVVGAGPERSNTAQLFLIAREQYVSPAALTCPANARVRAEEITALASANAVDFQRPEQLSYSYLNQFTAEPLKLEAMDRLAVLADKNPLFVEQAGRLGFDQEVALDAASRAHRGRGQNVLRSDGSVSWSTRPEVDGPDGKDNIWTANGITRYTGTETVDDPERDAFLAP